MTRKMELFLVPLTEAGLLLAIGGVGLALKLPLIFTSLGPTAYEQVEKPGYRSARPYNIIVGHVTALLCGFIALYFARGFNDPLPASAGYLTAARVLSSIIGCMLTALINLILYASQPAAFSTALLVTVGGYQSQRDAFTIVLAVVLLAAAGEPLRRQSLRLRKT